MERRMVMVVVILGMLGCAAPRPGYLPIVLSGEELMAPHSSRHEIIGTLSVTRTRFGRDPFSAGDRIWAEEALREEARRLGADAITTPHVTIDAQTYLLFPMSEVRARAQAVRFR